MIRYNLFGYRHNWSRNRSLPKALGLERHYFVIAEPAHNLYRVAADLAIFNVHLLHTDTAI